MSLETTKGRIYQVYGLAVRSDWDLPYCELQQGVEPSVDLIECSKEDLREAASEAATLPHPEEWYDLSHLHDGSIYLHFPSLFCFWISAGGRRVLGHRLSNDYTESFYSYLLSFALSGALVELGIEQLHATSVLINGSAVAFMGNSGHGKSTLAAMFVRSGYKLLTDDVLVLRSREGVFYASPGLRRIKLFADTARYFLGDGIQGSRMNPLTEKMIIPLAPEQYHNAETKLEVLYVLAPPEARRDNGPVTITTFSKTDAFVELCKSTFNNHMFKPARLKTQFQFATDVASRVSIRSLYFDNGFGSLELVRDAVLEQMG